MKLSIDEVQIIPVKPHNGLVAFCTFVINKSIYMSSIAIHTKPQGGFRLVYPVKSLGTRQISIFHPITQEAGKQIEEAVVYKFEEVMKQNDRYNSYDS